MTPFGQEAAFRLEVEVLAPQALDPVSMGPVRVVSITGGRVLGRLEGTILPGGTDWQTVEADGSVGIEARYLLELTDGARIELQSRGRRGAGAGAFWSSIWLRTADPVHAWVNAAQFIGLGRKLDGHVAIDAFALPES
ncbi:MAG TPA: DUF3237 domain-containing protein [Novosphingobium sp.]|jgi:hypothetical protein|nr:DUF3237 domain-containing protein [Novosphingobium sp.]